MSAQTHSLHSAKSGSRPVSRFIKGVYQLSADLNKIVLSLLGALVLGWAGLITATVWTVTGLVPQIEQIQIVQERNSQWIADWPQTGELAADVRQSKDIEFILKEQEKTQHSILDLQERIQSLELLIRENRTR